MTRDQIIADLLAHAVTESTSGADPEAPADRQTSADDDPADNDDPADGDDSADDGPADRDDQGCGDGVTAAGGPLAAEPAAQVGVELRVGLSTLLGRDRHPGAIPGWGPIGADLARTMATAQRGAQWCFAITDDGGHLVFAGITRRRPAGGTQSSLRRGGVVELHVPESLLADLAADVAGGGEWAGVITDIAHQNLHRMPAAQDPAARFAGAALRRYIQLRDRACVFMGCRCPARAADLDHTIDHARDGVTTDANQGPACRHDHRLKHIGGWRLYQPEPGHFTWVSPLGAIYHTQPPPIIEDLPDPQPGLPYPLYGPMATVEDLPILERPPPRPDPPPAPPHDPVDPDEPPQF